MSNDPRYVSNELTHFVGRARADDNDRYGVLLKVLKEGCLTAPPATTSHFGMTFDPFELTGEELVSVHSVCFCEVPVSDLRVHTRKYGRVGLAFSKSLLVKRGANPVFYVAADSPSLVVDHEAYARALAEYVADAAGAERRYGVPFNSFKLRENFARLTTRRKRFHEAAADYLPAMSMAIARLISSREPRVPGRVTAAHLEAVVDFLNREFFAYVKVFDTSHPDDNRASYYAEREWRVASDVRFSLLDVERIILPDRSFAKRLRVDVPEFDGQLTFVE
ncbi:MAG TPA: abortive infection system antitoxin AbiGi family protein [Polyangiaceae bacterium]